jgi:hypothetical protein
VRGPGRRERVLRRVAVELWTLEEWLYLKRSFWLANRAGAVADRADHVEAKLRNKRLTWKHKVGE